MAIQGQESLSKTILQQHDIFTTTKLLQTKQPKDKRVWKGLNRSTQDYRRHIVGPSQKCQIIAIFQKNQFNLTNFNLQYYY
jgi:hypothetical protein